MQDIWKLQVLEYSETETHKKRVEFSKEIVKKAFERGKTPYVSVSGGKDSTVVMSLVGNIRKVHHDDEFCLSVTTKYLSSIEGLITLKTEAKHTDWFVTNKGHNDLSNLDFDLCFLGLRAEENSYRKVHLASKGWLYESKGKHYCNPIAWWKIEDVWAYLLSNSIDYNRAYDIMRNKNIPINRQRIGPFANHRAIGYGQLQILKKCFPEDYNKFCSKHPIARSYA